jgi:hypothetical protein
MWLLFLIHVGVFINAAQFLFLSYSLSFLILHYDDPLVQAPVLPPSFHTHLTTAKPPVHTDEPHYLWQVALKFRVNL